MTPGPALLRRVLSGREPALIFGDEGALDRTLDRIRAVTKKPVAPLDLRRVGPATDVDALRGMLSSAPSEPPVVIVGEEVDDRVRVLLFEAAHGRPNGSAGRPARAGEARPVPMVVLQSAARPSASLMALFGMRLSASRFDPPPRHGGAKRGG